MHDDLGLRVTDDILWSPGVETLPGESYAYRPDSWSYVSCGGTPYEIWNADKRLRSTSLTERQKAGAFVVVDLPGTTVGTCSGAFMLTGSVLTAAHCLHDDSGNLYDPDDISVCSRGNGYTGADCVTVNYRYIHPDYNSASGWDPADDIAVLDIPFIAGHTYLWLSAYTDSFVTGYDMHNIAFPDHSPPSATCSSNTTAPVDSSVPVGNKLTHSIYGITAPFYVATYHSKMDGGKGHSGSPVYFCGDDWCDTGEHGSIVGVWSGWNPVYKRKVFSKVNARRLWIMGVW